MDTNTKTTTSVGPFDVSSFIEKYLRSSEHSWSIGISGAIAEFMYDDDEQVDLRVSDTQVSAITPRGAMQIHITPEMECVAYEELSPCIKSWSQSIAFCIPQSSALLERNNVLTELGDDAYAINKSSKQKLLFDMGLDSSYLQFCIRTSDNALIEILRNNCGRSIFAPENPASRAILEASPARVIMSGPGRIEIESKIPASAAEIPVGPHTHLLPALLNSNKSATKELPEGYIEALSLYPEHPLFDKYGHQRSLKQSAYDDFQGLLTRFGAEDYCHEKNRISKEMLQNPNVFQANSKDLPWQRRAMRIASMQAGFLGSQ